MSSRVRTTGEASRRQRPPVRVRLKLAFVRISTNPRAVRTPLPPEEACAIIGALFERPGVVIVEPGEEFWRTFERLVADSKASGPLITDAVLAALAIEQGATVCTTDRDFRRFADLSILDPTA